MNFVTSIVIFHQGIHNGLFQITDMVTFREDLKWDFEQVELIYGVINLVTWLVYRLYPSHMTKVLTYLLPHFSKEHHWFKLQLRIVAISGVFIFSFLKHRLLKKVHDNWLKHRAQCVDFSENCRGWGRSGTFTSRRLIFARLVFQWIDFRGRGVCKSAKITQNFCGNHILACLTWPKVLNKILLFSRLDC